MSSLKQSTAYTRMFQMVDATDHVTGKTGLTVTVTLSKAGGAFGAAGGAVTEVSSGWYKLALNTTDTNTLGDLAFHCTGTGADPTDFVDHVSARLVDDVAPSSTALTNATWTDAKAAFLDAAVTSRAAAATALTNATWTDAKAGFLDVAITSRLAPTTAGRTLLVTTGGHSAIDWGNVNAPTTTVGLTGTTIATSQAVSSVSGAVGSVTGNVGGNVAGSIGSLAAQAKADVNAEADTALADINLDHLVKNAVDTNFATTVHLDSVIGQIADAGTTATFDRTTDSLEALQVSQITSAALVTLIWSEALPGAYGAGTAGDLLGSAGAAADPWVTTLPGSYTSGQAGKIIGDALATMIPQTGNCYTRLGDPLGGETISSRIALVQADTDNIQTRIPAALVGGTRMDCSVGAVATGAIAAAAFAADALSATAFAQGAADKVWSTAARALTDKAGFALADATSDAVIADAVWNALKASYGVANSYGELLENTLDAAITSRAASATALSTATWTSGRASALDNLDATISSRAAAATALTNATWTDAKAGFLTGDAFVRLGAPVGGVSISADIAAKPTAIQNADGLLTRNMASVAEGAGRTPLQALRSLRNFVGVVAGVISVMKEDDVTTSWTGAVTTAAGDPIASIDPA